MIKLLSTILVILIQIHASAQFTPDTVVIELASSSKVVFTIGDRSDLEQLREYDYQALFDDIFLQLESEEAPAPHSPIAGDPPMTEKKGRTIKSQNYDVKWNDDLRFKVFPDGNTYVNFELGMNNYFDNGSFDDMQVQPYSVRPWGSWFFSTGFMHRFRFSRNFSLESTLSMSVHSFKLEDDNIRLVRTDHGVEFEPDPRNVDFIKSKLSVTYLNASFIPMFDIGKPKPGCEEHTLRYNFRLGLGPYIGHRIASYTKQRYEIDGEKENDLERGRFDLENIRYGVRLRVGVDGTDLFFDYDLNTLFLKGRGPELNAWSVGFIF